MNNNQKGFLTWFTMGFAVIWAVLIGLDYGNKHPGYYFSFSYFRYTVLYLVISMIGIGSYFLKPKLTSNIKWLQLRGIHLFGFICILFFIIIFANRNYGETPSTFSHLFSFWSRSIFNLSMLLIFFSIMRSLGQLIGARLLSEYRFQSFIIDTAIGTMIFTLLLFFVGAANLLSVTTVLLLLFISVIANVTFFVSSVKGYLLAPINIDRVNFMGWASFIFVLFFLSLNYLSTNIPYPAGFDSRNVYVNISKLIASSGGLAEGFQPYNWSLLMSVGFIMFDYVELALGLSFSAIVLSVIGVKELSTKVLKIDINKTLFITALFVVTPALVNQMFIEIKADFGMLFVQLASLLVFFKWISEKDTQAGDHYKLLVLLGMLCGYGMGIKLINMFLVFVLIALIWWNENNKYSLAGILLISVAILIFAGIDDLSGLQAYHKSINLTSMFCGVSGIGLIVFGFIKHKVSSIKNITYSMIMGVSILVAFSPWIGKNFIESKSLNPKTLILGKGSGPDIGNFNTINRNYRNSKKK